MMFGSDLELREYKSETQLSQVRVRANEECLGRDSDYAKGSQYIRRERKLQMYVSMCVCLGIYVYLC